jgi:hypothetical protein
MIEAMLILGGVVAIWFFRRVVILIVIGFLLYLAFFHHTDHRTPPGYRLGHVGGADLRRDRASLLDQQSPGQQQPGRGQSASAA